MISLKIAGFAFAATLLTALAGSVSSASAADTKTMVAADCFIRGIAVPTSNGQLLNISQVSSTKAYCGLVRDNTIAKPLRVQVTVVDNSSLLIGDGNFTCQLRAVSKNGLAQSLGAPVSTAGTNAAGVTLSLPIPPTLFVGGTYVVSCKMPRRGVGDPSSSFASIYWDEP